jgi:hypothetical protein
MSAVCARSPKRGVVLIPGAQPEGHWIVDAQDGFRHVYLGLPVIQAPLDEVLGHRKRAAELGNVLRYWIGVDRRNILLRETQLHWVRGPAEWVPNQVPPEGATFLEFCWNHVNLAVCADNLGMAMTAFRRTFQDVMTAAGVQPQDIEATEKLAALDSAIAAWDEVSVFNHLARRVLTDTGVSLGPEPTNPGAIGLLWERYCEHCGQRHSS